MGQRRDRDVILKQNNKNLLQNTFAIKEKEKNTNNTDVAPWCYKWIGYGWDGMDWMVSGWGEV